MGFPALERMMLADVSTYLPFNQLAYGDRMSMAQSLEVRVPFVDQKLTLGTWQQVIYIDFDNRPRQRELVLQIIGE